MSRWQAPQKREKIIVVEQCIFYLFSKLDNLVNFPMPLAKTFVFMLPKREGEINRRKEELWIHMERRGRK
jgi:hypothetical protein